MRETLDNGADVREVSPTDLREQTGDAFLRWSVPDAGVLGTWRVGESFAVARTRGLRQALPAPWVLLLGDPAELAALVDALPDLLGAVPGAVTVSAPAYSVIPADRWGLAVRGRWDYLLTAAPAAVPEDVRIQAVYDDAAIHEVLDMGNADAHARAGGPQHPWAVSAALTVRGLRDISPEARVQPDLAKLSG